jgi:hypothetical protein
MLSCTTPELTTGGHAWVVPPNSAHTSACPACAACLVTPPKSSAIALGTQNCMPGPVFLSGLVTLPVGLKVSNVLTVHLQQHSTSNPVGAYVGERGSTRLVSCWLMTLSWRS